MGFLDYDVEIRKIICSTNVIESLNAHYRRAVRARGHYPTEQAALKCLYLVTRSLDRSLNAMASPAAREPGPLDLGAVSDRGEGRLDRVRGAQVDPVLGGVVVEREQLVEVVGDLRDRSQARWVARCVYDHRDHLRKTVPRTSRKEVHRHKAYGHTTNHQTG